MKYIITISYDGSKYYGLQKLKNLPTIQGELEKILTKIDEKPIKVTSAGRTDRGVHALKQVCTFELTKDIDPFKLKGVLNTQSSPYLYIISCNYLNNINFHPRFDVKTKIYSYLINIGPYDPIKEDYLYNYNKHLDLELMKSASKLLIGAHSYKAFVVGKHKTYDSIIDSIDINLEQNIIKVTIKGAAFYTYMIRNIITILILIGSKTIDENIIKDMFFYQKKVIEYAPAPASGLFLEDIIY